MVKLSMFKIKLSDLRNVISKTSFANNGDRNEQLYYDFIVRGFSNCEEFWKFFIVPYTNRINVNLEGHSLRIHPRENVSHDIWDIGSIHYSIFLNFIYANNHLKNFILSSFEDFYLHMVTVCDLAELFLLKIYFLILECEGDKNKINVDEDGFIKEITKNIDRYKEKFLETGKSAVKIFPKQIKVLDEYFMQSNDVIKKVWKEYKHFSKYYVNTGMSLLMMCK